MTPRQQTFVRGIVAMTALGVLFVYLWPYVAPFLLALLFAALIDPFVGWAQRRLKVGRGVAVLIVISLFVVAFGGVIALIVSNLTVEFEGLLRELPHFSLQARQHIEATLHRIEGWFVRWFPAFANLWRPQADDWAKVAETGAKAVLSTLKGAPNALFVLFVGGLATYFISKDRHMLWHGVLQFVPPEWRQPVVHFRDEILAGALGIVGTQLTLIGLTAFAAVLGLLLLGVPYAWVLGLLAGLLDIAPFLGPSTVFTAVAAVYLLKGRLWHAIATLLLCLLIVLARQLVEPYLFGARLGLHPFTTLVALYVGVKALGVVGVIVGPLALIVVKAFFVVMLAPSLPRS